MPLAYKVWSPDVRKDVENNLKQNQDFKKVFSMKMKIVMQSWSFPQIVTHHNNLQNDVNVIV